MRGFGKLGAVSVLSADSVIMGTGFGVALSAMEAHRYPVISSVGSSMFLNSNDVAIAFLAACCVYYAVRRGGPPRLRAGALCLKPNRKSFLRPSPKRRKPPAPCPNRNISRLFSK